MQNKKARLEEIQSAISTILTGGQSYKIGSRSLTRADLSKLYEMQKELESEIADEDNCVLGRRAATAVFNRR